MFIKPIIKWFFLYTFISSATTFSIVPSTLAFGSQNKQLVESDKKLHRERRSGRGRGRPSSPHSTRSDSGASALHTRDGSPPGRLTTSKSPPSSPGWEVTSHKKTRKRPSPTKAQGSPPKQQKMQQRPLLQPKSRSTVQAPNATEDQARAKARQAIGSSDHIRPFNFLDPNDPKKGFRLQWNVNKDSNLGMEHILKRHTYEYHDGSSKPTQSMFPKGTTHRNIVEMIQQVVENKTNIPTQPAATAGRKFDPTFWQVRGKANNGTSLVVGYKDNGPNKPRDILQAYPLGSTVNVVPHTSRQRRSGRVLPMLDMVGGMNQIIDPFVNDQVQMIMNSPFFQAGVRKNRLHNTTLRALSLEFSDTENWPEAINSISCDNQTGAITLSWSWKDQHTNIVNPKSFSLYKNCVFNQTCTSIQVENEAIFEAQPEKNALTDYFIRCNYGTEGTERQDSAAIRIGAETVTDLKATISSNDKILLNWKFFDSRNINQNPSASDLEGRAALEGQPSGFEKINWNDGKIQWKIFRNEESIEIGDGIITSFEDDEVEPNQIYVYRVMAFWEEEKSWHNQQHAIFYSKPLIVSTEQREDIGQEQLQVRTYLLKEDPYSFHKQSEEDENDYISIHSFEGRQLCRDIVKKSTIIWYGKPVEMLNGLIDIEFNGRSLLSPAHFTNVRMLWDYLLALVEEYLEKEQATIYFPDRPIPFSLKKKSQKMMEFQVGDKFVIIDEKRCLTAILQGAERFFTLLNMVSVDKDGVGKHSLLVTQIRSMQENLRTEKPSLDPALQLLAERVAFNKVLLKWSPISRGIENYKILLNEQEIITLPAHKTSYIHIFQPKEQEELYGYKLIAYNQDGTDKTDGFGIKITGSYLQIEKMTLPFALNWEFPEKDIPSIKYYEVFRDDVSVEVTENPTYTETIPVVGTSIYTIQALDSAEKPLEIQPIVMERNVSKLIKFIKLNWVFPEVAASACRKYQLRRRSRTILGTELQTTLGTQFQTTWIEKEPLAVGGYIYEVDALDYSSGRNEKIGSLQEHVSIVQEDLLNPIAPAQAISQLLVKRISADQVQLSWKPSVQNIKRYEVFINNTFLIELLGDQREYIHNMEQTGVPRNCVYMLTAYDQDDNKLESQSMGFAITSPFLLIKDNSDSRELNWGFSEQDMGSINSYKIFLNDTCIANDLPKNTTRYLHTTQVRIPRSGINTYRIEPVREENTCLTINPAIAEVGIPYLTAKVISGNRVELNWDFYEGYAVDIERYTVFGKKCLDDEFLCTTNDTIEFASTQRKEWTSYLVELPPGRYTYFVKAEGTSLPSQYVIVEIE